MSTNSSEGKPLDKKKITRRNFLKLSGSAGAMATLLSLIPFGRVFGGTNNNYTNINQTSNVNAIMNKSMSSSSVHFFDLDGAKPQFYSPTGSRTIMNVDNF
jgi:hypothetical protein